MVSGSLYALSAGLLAAAASLSAKLSLGADYLTDMCVSVLSGGTQTHTGHTACDWVRHVSVSKHCRFSLLIVHEQ